jgi:hypothetical protein
VIAEQAPELIRLPFATNQLIAAITASALWTDQIGLLHSRNMRRGPKDFQNPNSMGILVSGRFSHQWPDLNLAVA